jgi:hypothetical protein
MNDILKLIRKKKHSMYVRFVYIAIALFIFGGMVKYREHLKFHLSSYAHANNFKIPLYIKENNTAPSSSDHVTNALIIEINHVLKSLDTIEEHWKKDTNLIKILESMHPKKAAKRLDLVDKSTLCYIFSNISKKKGAMILEYLNPNAAKDVLIHLARRQNKK